MKKYYISPNVDVYEVKVCNLLSGSPEIKSGKAGAGDEDHPVNFAREFDFTDD